jgi:hypothetical protein
VRISRPCYDKFHRCPGWAGGGMLYAKVDRCEGGRLPDDAYDSRLWKWRINQCATCGVYVLPYVIRWLDWRQWDYVVRSAVRDLRYWWGTRRG